ncbi:hypothetical protein PF008_g17878 [Phytophthora fragariae]|uniref:Secreted protein n=1 Tax=Phytophthora fragariae TaxID=53985 RepID=A0A6G0R747_9STRA|nr:hypothetical protein PF008_g17878 [Phytophthora fragariae]
MVLGGIAVILGRFCLHSAATVDDFNMKRRHKTCSGWRLPCTIGHMLKRNKKSATPSASPSDELYSRGGHTVVFPTVW